MPKGSRTQLQLLGRMGCPSLMVGGLSLSSIIYTKSLTGNLMVVLMQMKSYSSTHFIKWVGDVSLLYVPFNVVPYERKVAKNNP